MKFTYQGTDYEFVDSDTWTTREAMLVQTHTGKRPLEIVEDFAHAGAFGLHAMAWVTLRQAGVNVEWDQFDLPFAPTVFDIFQQQGKLTAPVDPSTASTPQPKAEPAAGRKPSARSQKS